LWGRLETCGRVANRRLRRFPIGAQDTILPHRPGRRGSALLAVLWLSAALAAIAFSLSSTVRGETERTSTEVDGLRSYYLAAGAIDRASLELLWSVNTPDQRRIPQGSTAVNYNFPSGVAALRSSRKPPSWTSTRCCRKSYTAWWWRWASSPGGSRDHPRDCRLEDPPGAGAGAIDGYYLSLTPSFRARHASIEEIEELLLVKGVTPDIFYGTYVPIPDAELGGGLAWRRGPTGGLPLGIRIGSTGGRQHRRARRSGGHWPHSFAIQALVEHRRSAPFTQQQLVDFLQSVGVGSNRLRVEGHSIVTMRATARLRLPNGQLSDLRRTVGAQVKYMPVGYDSPIHILRWYDTAWSN